MHSTCAGVSQPVHACVLAQVECNQPQYVTCGVDCCSHAAWLQALLESPDAQAADTAGLQLAAALGFAVYGFKEWKRLPLGEQIRLSAWQYAAMLPAVNILLAAAGMWPDVSSNSSWLSQLSRLDIPCQLVTEG